MTDDQGRPSSYEKRRADRKKVGKRSGKWQEPKAARVDRSKQPSVYERWVRPDSRQ